MPSTDHYTERSRVLENPSTTARMVDEPPSDCRANGQKSVVEQIFTDAHQTGAGSLAPNLLVKFFLAAALCLPLLPFHSTFRCNRSVQYWY